MHLYILFSILSSIVSLLKVIIFAKILGAGDFAYFSLFEIIAAYGLYIGSAGLIDAAARLIPFYNGKKKERYSMIISCNVVGGLIYASGLTLIVYSILVISIVSDQEKILLLLVGGIFAFLNNMLSLALTFIISKGMQVQFASILFVKNVSSLIIGVIFGELFGLLGVLFSEVIIVLVLVGYTYSTRRYVPGIKFISIKKLYPQISQGMPLLINNLIQNISRNTERLIIGMVFGVTMLGQYSLAMIVVTAGIVMQNIISQYLNPKLCFAYGAGIKTRTTLRKIDYLFILFLSVSALMYPLVCIFLNRMRDTFFIDFSIGIELMKILFIACVLQLAQVYQGFFIAKNESWYLTRQAFITTFFSFIFCWYGATANCAPSFFAWIFVANRALSFALLRIPLFRIAI